MPTRKVGENPKNCDSPEHNPPVSKDFEPGLYEHFCPKCGRKQYFRVWGKY